MSPTGAAITPDALNTGLRQSQSESKNPVTIGSTGGADTFRRGPLRDRHRTFPGGWGVNPDKPYLGAPAPNADDSAVVGEADVADDGAQ
jgi:hypothetical protein